MLKSWWTSREPRERLLLIVAGAIAIVLGFYQFVFVPALNYAASAERRFERESSTFADVDRQLALYNANKSSVQQSSNLPVQAVVTNTSSIFGLQISRLEPGDDGEMTLWLERVPADLLYPWLTDLENNHGIGVSRANIRMLEDGLHLSVNIVVKRGK